MTGIDGREENKKKIPQGYQRMATTTTTTNITPTTPTHPTTRQMAATITSKPPRCCYDSFTYFSPLIFLIYSLHAPTSCLLFLVYILFSFYRLSFLSCAALLIMRSLMHSTITHAQSAY